MAKATMQPMTTFGVCFEPTLLKELDRVRGDVPRSKFIQRLVEKKLAKGDLI
jgi:metal-responsive CopG/Arc/MetJ family transcriptional regulator